MTDFAAMEELERRGALPDDLKLVLKQAREKGLAPKSSQSWGDVASQAASNLGPSAGNFLYNLTAPIHSPVETAKGLTQIAGGVGSKIVGLADRASEAVGGPDLQSPEQKEFAERGINAVGQFFADRYGSIDGLKKAIAEDPVGVAGDLSAVMTGGGAIAARAPGMVGRAGQAVRAAGQAIDPVVAGGRAVAGTARAAAPALGRASEAYTGVGEGVLSEAYQAGRQGGQAMQTLQGNMANPGANARAVVDQAQDAMRQLRQQRSADYNASMAATRADQTPLNIGAVRAELQNLRDDVNFRGIPGTGNTAANNVLDDIERAIVDFENRTGPAGATAEGLDFLKRRIGEFRDGRMQGTADRRVVDRMYNAARDQVANQVPDYAAAMQGYEGASELIDELSRALSLNDRASIDTTLRKLQSTMRNNANTSYGYRGELLDQIEAVSPGIRGALAGQALSSWAPRGINRATTGVAPAAALGVGGVPALPLAVGMAAASSPRIAGNVAMRAGQAAGALDNATQALGITPQNVARVTVPMQQVGKVGLEASPSKQAERALQQFKTAAEGLKTGATSPEVFRRSVNIAAQIIAQETNDTPQAVAERLMSLVEGAQ